MPSPSSRRALAALGVAVALTSGCDLVTGAAPAPVTGLPGSALETLATVDVRGRGPRTGYERDEFGDGWVDADRNGCDTRNDVLARDLTGETFVPGSRDCVVATGTLDDPYSGRTIAFRRGEGTSEAVQIDHVVALSDAWQKGARQWDDARRTQFANDPLNLLAVDGPLNMQKGDGDAATWLPPDRSYRCAYVARQVAVKATYGLWVTQAERDAMAAVLGTCPGEPLPGGQPLPAQETPQGPFPDCAAAGGGGAAAPPPAAPGGRPPHHSDRHGGASESLPAR
ncbi:HNH endonuclease family protein, partial [Geodermatophilus sp. SYSU D01106]